MKPVYLAESDLSSALSFTHIGSAANTRAFNPTAAPVTLNIATAPGLSAVAAKTGTVSDGRTNTISATTFAVADTLAFDLTAAPYSGPASAPYFIDNHQPYLGITFLVPLSGAFPPHWSLHDAPESGVNDAAFLGGMRMFAGNFAPSQTATASGQLLPIAQNTALFSLFGTYYGGDGKSTFALPDLDARAVVGVGSGPGLYERVLGEEYGSNTFEINSNVLPTSAGGSGIGFGNTQPTLATTYMIQVYGVFPSPSSLMSSNMDMMGLVVQFGGNFTPFGYLPCDGSLLPISEYEALFTLIGTTYGGDGQDTFALPDLRGRTVVGTGQGAGLSNRVLGEVIGTENQTIQQNQMPSDMGGSNQGVNNIQPSLALNYIISLQGIFPSQSAITDADPYTQFLGEIAISAIPYAPRGWAYCNGQLLSIAQNQALFSLLGTTYGGNGITTFALPDFRGRTAVGAGDGVVLGERGGTEVTYLSSAAMPHLTLNGNAGPNSLFGGGGNDTVNGNGANDRLVGNAGNDRLDGGVGNDTMEGGAGDDTYYVDATTDSIVELTNQGFDSAFSSATFSLAFTFIDNLYLTGSANINGTGNGQANLITGTVGNNKLDGGANNDTLNGGMGDDTYVISNVGDVINENANEGTDTVESAITFTLSNVLENLTLIGTTDINGTGNAGNNILTGNTGLNVLTGGAGNDTYNIQNTGDNVVEAANEGTDLINSTVTYSLSGRQVENLTLTGSAIVNATGNGLANILTGNGANNVLDGGSNNDTMAGGAGNDTYLISAVGDVVTENPNEGIDTIQSSFTTTLGANVENVTLNGAADINATGNALNNVLSGNYGINVLTGGAGNDTYYIQNAGDNVVEVSGGGSDVIFSSVTYSLNLRYAETLILNGSDNVNATGNSLGNTLGGNFGSNIINGKGGADNLSGGFGADIFLFDANSGTDTITDFSAAQNDSINIAAYTGGVANVGLVAQNGISVLITLGGGNTITVNNATQADVLAHIVW
ncbi:hemolysin-type calcium-binding repeat 2 copies family protein [Asticcacaulis biprosthecium C19]|uniref:Hemolysin-type calcium-binding repeat 2 copies family protein n=1 Tax=Asticcacaulis biprosthecium C19 TaxID=715226 RepID=F4QJU2_9CAUL|nr:tail fiber protein [Asticcacaulis biprosthecium]EGF93199.1 hemolysin-type calcium-binding repeat 2 copies family protein [Asticcacaulis biprosthecium C19]